MPEIAASYRIEGAGLSTLAQVAGPAFTLITRTIGKFYRVITTTALAAVTTTSQFGHPLDFERRPGAPFAAKEILQE